MRSQDKTLDAELTEVWRYPVKSCCGTSAGAAEMDPYGIVDDRVFAVTTESGALITQRVCPELNIVGAELLAESLRLSAPAMPDLVVPLREPGAAVQVELYDGAAPGVCMGPEAAAWFSAFLRRPCRLVQSRDLFPRQMHPSAAHLFLKEQRRYPDCSPLLLMNQASLDDLNSRLAKPVEMSRFRPNLVIKGLPPYLEDSLRRIRIGDITLKYMGLAERCSITLVAPGTRRREVEPLRTLRSYRFSSDRLYSGLIFGAYFQPQTYGKVSVGSRVDIELLGDAPTVGSVGLGR